MQFQQLNTTLTYANEQQTTTYTNIKAGRRQLTKKNKKVQNKWQHQTTKVGNECNCNNSTQHEHLHMKPVSNLVCSGRQSRLACMYHITLAIPYRSGDARERVQRLVETVQAEWLHVELEVGRLHHSRVRPDKHAQLRRCHRKWA